MTTEKWKPVGFDDKLKRLKKANDIQKMTDEEISPTQHELEDNRIMCNNWYEEGFRDGKAQAKNKTSVTGNSSQSDCRNCGKILRSSRELDYCEDCNRIYEKGKAQAKKEFIEMIEKMNKQVGTGKKGVYPTWQDKSNIFVKDIFRELKKQLESEE